MSSPKSTRQWVLASPVTDAPVLSSSGEEQTFRLESNVLPPLKENHVLVRVVYLSNDAVQRVLITKDIKSPYIRPIKVNEVMSAYGILEVIESASDALKPGMLVSSWVGWTEFAVIDANQATPLPDLPGGLEITHHLGAFGPNGSTAYYGLLEIAKVKPEDVLVVSAAAGATGSMVVQLAKKLVGCKRVIGIAGGEKKCRWVEQYLGADVCVDYKSASFQEDLAKATGGDKPDVNVYFDNVGGPILDRMLSRMALFGRVAACGTISTYNTSSDNVTGLKNWFEIVIKRLQIRGFSNADYYHKKEEMVQYFLKGVQDGKLKIGEENNHVVAAKFENIPKVWIKLYEGENKGKLITKLEA